MTLAIPNAVGLDPITLGNWGRSAESCGYQRLEVIARQGRPWGTGPPFLAVVRARTVQSNPGRWRCLDGLGLSLSQGLAAWQGGSQFCGSACGPGRGHSSGKACSPIRAPGIGELEDFANLYLGIPLPLIDAAFLASTQKPLQSQPILIGLKKGLDQGAGAVLLVLTPRHSRSLARKVSNSLRIPCRSPRAS